MSTEYSGYRNRDTERVAYKFGDYLLGFGDWIWEDLEYYAKEGYSKADVTNCLADNMEEYFVNIHTELMEKSNPVERLFIADVEDLDIDYREIAEAFAGAYEPDEDSTTVSNCAKKSAKSKCIKRTGTSKGNAKKPSQSNNRKPRTTSKRKPAKTATARRH